MSQAGNPVFVVGASRSGTALMQSILNNHSNINISGESHYFDDLRNRMAGFETSALDEDQRQECEDYFLALGHRPYGHDGDPECSDISREELRTISCDRGEGADAYFEAFCFIRARNKGKVIWGDKTPRHVFRIPEIVNRYSASRVVCLVRDPRAVVASYRDWKHHGGFDLEADPEHAQALATEERRARRSYNVIIASYLWKASVQAALQARERFGASQVLIQRYEDLVHEPAKSIGAMCDWLELRYDPAMLEVPIHNSSFEHHQETGGISTKPIERWRTKLSDTEIAIIQSCCGKTMLDAEYELLRVRGSMREEAVTWGLLPFAILRAAQANRSRTGNLPSYLWRRIAILLKSAPARDV